MSPRRLDVSEETARRWTELSRQGWPFARIGREEGVDRRTVARIVRQRWGKHVGEAAAQARGEVASRMLEEHFRDMETVATTVLRALVPPSLRDSLFVEVPDMEVLLQERVADWWLRMKHMYLPGTGPDEVDRRRARRQAQALLMALQEHQPLVKTLVGDWSRCAQDYYRLWLEIEGKAQAAGFSGPVTRSAVEEALRGSMRGDASSHVATAPGLVLPGPDLERVGRWLAADREARACLARLGKLMEEMENTFEALEEALDPAPLRQALLESRCRLCLA